MHARRWIAAALALAAVVAVPVGPAPDPAGAAQGHPPAADMDGDGDSDVVVFRPTTGEWLVDGSTLPSFGGPGDLPVPADYDGDGIVDQAVFRPADGQWWFEGVDEPLALGADGDLPVPADYDRVPGAEAAVFRPSDGRWFVEGEAEPVGTLGLPEDVPVPGPWDEDPEDDLAVFRPSESTWYVDGAEPVVFGTQGDVPVPGDYDGDGLWDRSVYRGSVATWLVEDLPSVALGVPGDLPVPGDYDGDGDTDRAVYIPRLGFWQMDTGAFLSFGALDDLPVATAPAVLLDALGCGPYRLKEDGTLWRCTFADDFDGTALDRTRWNPQQTRVSGFYPGSTCIVDDPDNVAVADGALRLTVRREEEPIDCGGLSGEYTGGSVSTFLRFSQTYGRYEFRARLGPEEAWGPAAIAQPRKGLQTSLWLWPDQQRYGPWPRSGEIDIAEMYSPYPDRFIPYIHYRTRLPKDPTVTNTRTCRPPDLMEYHSYELEWTPTTLTISYDGVVCLVHKIDPAAPLVAPQPLDHPFMLVATQALGEPNAYVPSDNSVTPDTPLPATTEVDWVRVWK